MASDNKGADMELGANGDNDVAAEPPPKKKSSRRPDIDLIRVVLTWGILLYHTVLVYTPYARSQSLWDYFGLRREPNV